MGDHNEGIVVSGGSITADVLSVGRRAQAIKNVGASALELESRGQLELAERVRELIGAIDAHAASLEHPDEAMRSAELVAEELAKEEPDKLTVRAILGGLLQAAGSVTAMAHAVTAVGAIL
jgi:hypothetical protein